MDCDDLSTVGTQETGNTLRHAPRVSMCQRLSTAPEGNICKLSPLWVVEDILDCRSLPNSKQM